MLWLQKPTLLEFKCWLQTRRGQTLIETEAQAMEPWVRRAFGYHTVLVGEPEWKACCREHPIKHTIWLHPNAVFSQQWEPLSALKGDWHAMPLDADSIDMIFMPHVLEQEAGADMLREAYRVLLPQGHLVLSTFNRWSLFGLMKPFLRQIPGSFWKANWMSQSRLKDWLALLGFTLLEVKTVFFRWPYSVCQQKIEPTFLARDRFERVCQILLPQFGSSILMFAQKTVRPLTPIKPTWKVGSEKKIPTGEGLEPTINA